MMQNQLGRWMIDIMRASEKRQRRAAAIKGWKTRRLGVAVKAEQAIGYARCDGCNGPILADRKLCGRCWSMLHTSLLV